MADFVAADVTPAAPAPRRRADRLALFAALWAAAALFHALGPSGRATGIVDGVTAVGVGHMLLVLAALWVLAAPYRLMPLVALAALGPITAWQEAPILGNHWFVAAAVDAGLLLALLASRRDRAFDTAALTDGFLPVARWILVAFYAFAAFDKLNSAFFDTTVSCGALYFDETVRTLGLSAPLAVGHGGWASFVPIATAATELSIPLLLLRRRTRTAGVVVGLVFHGLIALDQEHLFSDFSSVLSALFVLFLPEDFASFVVDLVRRRGRAIFSGWIGLAAVASVAQWFDRSGIVDSVYVDGRMWLWLLLDGALVGTAGWWIWQQRPAALARPFALSRRARGLAVVPLVVILNGFTPYVELKTAFSYSMYSNLSTVDGETNHFLLPATLPIGHRQADLVRVIASTDSSLSVYASRGYLLPWDSFRAYLSGHPRVRVRYERDGVVHNLVRASDEPGLTDAPPTVVQKLLPLRAVDTHDPPRCQENFLPAL